ncbi:MAG TPA: hypothetical protein VKH81_08085 [Candidatus Angelobacter sp.]|nr:hypothetical protein [Candidatus Angelobacter sp.]
MKHVSMLAAVLSLATAAVAQKVDASFVIGVGFANDAKVLVAGVCLTPCSPTSTFETQPMVFFAGSGAVRLLNFKVASVHLEVPIEGGPSADVTQINVFGARIPGGSISSLFITPSVRLKLVPNAAISPWGSIGGGWGRYKINSFNAAINKAALQFGGGVDFKTRIPLLGFRVEARDFVTDQPDFANFNVLPPGSRLIDSRRHNVLAGGGIVLHF